MTTTKLTQQEYRDSLAMQNKPSARLSTGIGAKGKLRSHGWSDQEIIKIPNESFATLAYEESDTLPKEFSTCVAFLAYWRGQRRRHGLSAELRKEAMDTQDTAEQDRQFKEAWNRTPALQAEFCDSFSAYCAFKRAENRGGIRAVVGRMTGPQSKGA